MTSSQAPQGPQPSTDAGSKHLHEPPRLGDVGGIVLVSCYEPGYQPLVVASAAAFLAKAGYAPLCLDLAVEDLEQIGVDRLRRPRLVAISVPMHTAMILGLRVAERVRVINPAAHICFFGLYAHLNRALLERVAAPGQRPLADSIFGPECEELLVELAGGLREHGVPPTPPPGTVRLRRLPFLPPARENLPPLDRYARLLVGRERRVTGYVETTRGCLYSCRHCPIPPFYNGRFFAVPADLVGDDIDNQIAAGARHIIFGDPDFLNSSKHGLGIVRRMHASHPDVTFSFTAKVEHIIAHRALFPELASLGCVFMVSAVESLSDRVLGILDKRHTRQDVYAAIDIVRDAGISLRPTFVAFTPWTTLEDYVELCDLIYSHHLEHEVDPVQLAIRLLVPPGSLLAQSPELAPFLDHGPFDERSLTYAWIHPDARMDRLYESVAAVAEEAARADEDPAVTFARIHEMAAAMDGRASSATRHGPRDLQAAQREPPPRLSEPWFCCAQPTRTQLARSAQPVPLRKR
jgi:radical SAM superfamily enzyme YgiQ (UPF0313 family)